jgi:UDP-4-amino-4-deoxy-L-arabinose formyltransferase/UDP-glucuronic acid dehydrogenase (UDP-4-keto-hexauronic acid decarboxylating)
MKKTSIIIFGCRSNTLDFINSLDQKKYIIKSIISISPITAKKNRVSGYINLKNFKKIKSKVIISKKYNLQNSLINYFEKNNCELGISIGWQRIIPEKILKSFQKGVYGMHCSYLKLPRGKGRSPIIWTIIKGYKHLFLHIFKYVSKFDEGPIIFREKIKIYDYENIHDIQKKLSLIFSNFINNLNLKKLKYAKKIKTSRNISFLKRDENSGLVILKNHNAFSFCNFVRAQTDPYPCAYILYKKIKFRIVEAHTFIEKEKNLIRKNLKYYIFNDKTFIFKLKNQYVYVKKHKINKKYLKNEIFDKIFV